MSNPSARALGITVPQYLGLDLDSADEKQLAMLMDMHMEVFENITIVSFRPSSKLRQTEFVSLKQAKDSDYCIHVNTMIFP